MVDKLDLGLKSRMPAPAPWRGKPVFPAVEIEPPARLLSGILRVEVTEDGTGLSALEHEWRELLAESEVDNLFLTWEWLSTWWRHQAAGRCLHILTVRRDGELLAIAPLALRPIQPERMLPWRALEFMGMGSVGSDYLDLIVRRGTEEESVRALADYLSERRLVLELRRVRAGSRLVTRLASQLQDDGWSASQTITDVCPYLELAGHDWDSYLAGVGSAHRQNVRRRLRRIAADFQVDFREVRSERQRRETLPLFVDLHRKRWNGRKSDALTDQATVDFHQEFSALALQRGWLRLYLLSLDEVAVASIYGFRYGEVFYFYQSGFDPEYREHSVGLVTMALTIQRAIAEGAAAYDMLHGDEEYKFLWTRSARDLARFDCYPPNPQGAFCRHAMDLRQGLKRVVEWPRRFMGEGG